MKSNYSVFTSLSRIVYNVKEKIASLDNKQTGCDVMKIEKINENQIRCTLTKEDLEERQLRLSELAYGSDKAKELFRDMMQQANLQFGFEANDIPLMIEAIPISSESIILIISKVEDPEELDTRFSKFTPFGEPSSEPSPAIEMEGADDTLDLFSKIYKASEEQKKKKREKKDIVSQEPETNTPSEHINLRREYVFPDLDTVIEAAHGLNNFFQGFSSLYKDKKADTYSLLLHQDQTSPEDFNRVCNMLSEYGNGKKLSPAREAFLAEHEGCILPTEALQKLILI